MFDINLTILQVRVSHATMLHHSFWQLLKFWYALLIVGVLYQ